MTWVKQRDSPSLTQSDALLLQEAQLSQRGRVTVRLVENFVELLKIIRNYNIGCLWVPISSAL